MSNKNRIVLPMVRSLFGKSPSALLLDEYLGMQFICENLYVLHTFRWAIAFQTSAPHCEANNIYSVLLDHNCYQSTKPTITTTIITRHIIL